MVIATIHGTRQYVQLTGKSVAGIDPDSGEVLWKADREGKTAVITTPVIDGDVVFVTSAYGVGCNAFRISKSGGKWSTEELYANKGHCQPPRWRCAAGWPRLRRDGWHVSLPGNREWRIDSERTQRRERCDHVCRRPVLPARRAGADGFDQGHTGGLRGRSVASISRTEASGRHGRILSWRTANSIFATRGYCSATT